MQSEYPVCCTTSVAIGQRAFNNYNGIGMSVCFSPQPPSAAALSASSTLSRTASQLQPPPMLAVVLDASMAEEAMRAATQSLTQALNMLNPQTRLLLLVVDQVVSMVDLKTSKPQSWVVHGVGSQGASVLPQIVRAADIRATPLAHCEPFLASSLAALRHYPHQQSVPQHLRITAAAVDIALFLLTASMAAWDAQHKQQQQQQLSGGIANSNGISVAQAGHQQGPATMQQQQQQLLAPMHNARVMVLTGLPNSSTPSLASAAELLQHLEQQQAQQVQQMFSAIGNKAASLDIPVDVITGSLSAPAALLLQGAVAASFGRLLYQPGLKPPLASNIAATVQSRFGWEAVIDVRVPPGVKVVQLSGPAAINQGLPDAASTSGVQVPVVLVGAGSRGAPPASLAAAAAADGAAAAAGQQAGPLGSSSSSNPAGSSPAGSAAASGSASGVVSAAAAAAGAVSVALSTGPMSWSPAAAAVPVLSSGSRFVAVLELSKDWQAGSSIEVQVVCEWSAADGRRLRQICSHTIQVSDRLTPFLEGLDVPAVVLLMAQQLVAAALAAAAPSAGTLAAAAAPKPRSIEEGRLSVGMALAHVAQRMGHAHTSRRGILGFGSQQVWQLPDDLIPLALSLYQLQRSPLLDPYARDPEPCEAAAPQNPTPNTTSSSSSNALMYGSWRMLVQQFMQSGPNAALRMVAPWLYVFDSTSGQFEVLPPLNLALEPDALAVLDCGSELIIFVGEVLEALVEGIPTTQERDEQQQQQQQPGSQASAAAEQAGQTQQQQGNATGASLAAAAAAGTAAAAAEEGSAAAGSGKSAGRLPDMAVAAAPAVQCAHQLSRGRLPVPAIRLIEDVAGMANMMQRLVPLHEDPVALQLLLLPHLRDLTPAQHGYLLDWHRHWASVAAAAAAAQSGAGVSGRAAGGARLTRGEEKQRQLSFGQWYSSFGVVLRSPGGILEGSSAVE